MKTATINKVLRFILNHLRFAMVVLVIVFACTFLFVALNLKDAKALFQQAQEEMGTGHPEEALETLQRIERDFPGWAKIEEVYYLQGNILYFHKNEIPNAIERWNRVLALNPHSPHDFTIQVRLAEIYQNVVGDNAEAVKHWRQLIHQYPDNPEIPRFRMNLADCYVKLDQYEVALLELKNLLTQLHDEHLRQQTTIRIAAIYYLRKSYQKARETLEPVVAHPHCDDCRHTALLIYTDILEIQEDYDKAVEILGQIPDNILSQQQKQQRIAEMRRKTLPVVPRSGK
jgi:tetratricopeptide (TPR) repeat protein